MEINLEIFSESGSESPSIPYSHMTEEDAQRAYSARKDQIRMMLKGRSCVQTPESVDSKYSVSSTKSKKSTPSMPSRFIADPLLISKHAIDLPLRSQHELKERLKTHNPATPNNSRKYNTNQPLYKRTVEWKLNLKREKQKKKDLEDQKELDGCTFEPNIEKSEARNNSLGLYERNVLWKNSMIRRNEEIKDQNKLKEIEECSFKPDIKKTAIEFEAGFQERNLIWQERLIKKAKRIEEENSKDHVFYPKINRRKSKGRVSTDFENRFERFLSKLDQVSEKIDMSLAKSVFTPPIYYEF